MKINYRFPNYIFAIFIMLFFIQQSMFFASFSQETDTDNEDAKILIIYSYDSGFDTVVPIANGIQTALKDNNVRIDVDFMNSKGTFINQHFYNYYMSLKYKLKNSTPYDMIFISDDNALIFIQKYGDELFPKTPIIFTGINNIENGILASISPYITGVIEQPSIESTISIASKLNPNAKSIYAISDNTFTGKSELTKYLSLEYLFPNLEFNTIDLSSITFKKLRSELSNLNDESIILLLSAYKDVNSKEYSFKNSTKFILKYSKQPVYHIYEHGIEQGLIGGKVVSHYEQGLQAGLIAKDILEGQSIETFTDVKSTKNQYIFNHDALLKYGIDEKLLPKDIKLLNYEKSFLEKYFVYLLFILFIIISQTVIIVSLITANRIRKSTQSKLEDLIYKDNLTGLLSRYAMEQLIDKELSSDKKNDIVLVFIDIDNFKHINDNLGHNFGDIVLNYVGEILSSLEDDSTSICRFSGDEFLVLVNNIKTREQAMWLINSIQNLFDKTIEIENHSLRLTVSIGVALSNVKNINRTNLFKMADLALYAAKESGRNTFFFYEENMGISLSEKLEFHKLIKEAMENNEFDLFYQPYIDTPTQEIIGFEALIRWFSPKHGFISPYKLIVNAEEIGLIVELGHWIMKKAFKFSRLINLNRPSPLRISINLSPVQLLQSNFVQTVKDLIKITNIETHWICFEITESSIIESFETSVLILEELLSLGFDIVIDDFGTGYSSLSYLKNLPITGMKIDKAFIDNVANSPEDLKFVELMIDISRVLDIKITAEGIEDYEQYLVLQSLGCDYIQGYYFGKPASYADTKEFLGIK
ncbi:MAG: ABC transporter substrate binding protein [Acidaminobacteraceae bacterium]